LKTDKKYFIFTLAVLSMLFWGMSFVWTKIVLEYYAPITTIFLRLIISSIVLFVVLKLTKKLESVQRKHYALFFISAMFEPLLYFLGENFGLREVSSTVASVIIATIPVITPIFAYFLLKEKLTIFNILGIIISFLGIIIMIFDHNFNFTASPKGIMLLFLAVFSTIGYAVTIKKLAVIYNSPTIITFQNIIGVFYFLPLFLIFDIKEFITIRPSFNAIASLFQLAIFASSLAFICYIHVVSKLGVSRANIFTNLIPIITAIFSYFLLDEKFTIAKLIGISIVIIGVFLSQIDKLIVKVNNGKRLKIKVDKEL
jgi:drug/metabolite transporter (DMT)-like permease